jgi:hypothetical protein
MISANTAVFVWTPRTDLYSDLRTYPLRGRVHVTTIPENAYHQQHPKSRGACDVGWEEFSARQRIAQRIVTEMIHEDNIDVFEVQRAFMEIDEFASFPFSIERPAHHDC